MPIVNVEDVGRIEFPDSMSREEIDAAIRNEILPAFQRGAAATSPEAITTLSPGLDPGVASVGPNPFSRGTARADTNYKVGDRYHYRLIDPITKLESSEMQEGTVTRVTDTEVIYDNGSRTDLLGNVIKSTSGLTFTGRQFYVEEYRIGRKWTTTYRGMHLDRTPDEYDYDFVVVARELVTVPAGTFDAFKVEGFGYSRAGSSRFRVEYWIAPDKVRRVIVLESIQHNRSGRLSNSSRIELVSFSQT